MPPPDEVRGWIRLTTTVADRVVAATVQDMHRAISAGAFRWVGPLARPVQRIYDRATDGVYGAVRAGIRGAGALGAAWLAHRGAAHPGGRPELTPTSTPAATKARAIAHGVVAEPLLRDAPELDLDVTLRQADRDLEPSEEALAAAYPDARGQLVVFVHGLVDTEHVWRAPAADEVTLPMRAADAATPLLVRYGTGRPIGRNGADLAALLDAVVGAWPVPVERLVLVGHSMGGLVGRAAGVVGVRAGHAWPGLLSDVVYLGTPHLGSWLEKVANVASWTLRRAAPQSAPIGALLDGRSRGIKDLRFGALDEHAWSEAALDDLLSGRLPDEPWQRGVTHHLVVGRLRQRPADPVNLLLGDALVRARSAAGASRRRLIAAGGRVRVTEVAASHTRLVRAPEVAAVLTEVLADRDADGPDPSG